MLLLDAPHQGQPVQALLPEQPPQSNVWPLLRAAMDGQPGMVAFERGGQPWHLVAIPDANGVQCRCVPATTVPSNAAALLAEYAVQGGAIRPLAHNVNNQLGAICNYAALLEHHLQEQHQKELSNIQQLSFKAADQLNSLRSLSAPIEEPFVRMELNQWLNTLITGARKRYPQHVIRLGDTPQISIHAASNVLTSAMHAILQNATDACTQSDIITVYASLSTLNAGDLVGWEATPGPFVHLHIEDTGHGIATQHANEYLRLYKGTHPGRGTGLPLAISMIRQHHGRLQLSTADRAGTAVTLSLPIKPPSVQKKKRKGFTARRTGGQSQTLLIADDTPAVLRATARLLQREGYKVVSASNGDEVLSLFAESPHQFDAALLDGNLSGMGGIALAGKLTTDRPDLPVLLLAGAPLPVDCIWPILDKPYRPRQLLSMLRTLFH